MTELTKAGTAELEAVIAAGSEIDNRRAAAEAAAGELARRAAAAARKAAQARLTELDGVVAQGNRELEALGRKHLQMVNDLLISCHKPAGELAAALVAAQSERYELVEKFPDLAATGVYPVNEDALVMASFYPAPVPPFSALQGWNLYALRQATANAIGLYAAALVAKKGK